MEKGSTRLVETYAGGPNAALTLAQLAGDPPHDRPEVQIQYLPQEVITDIKDAAQKAILQIQPAGPPDGIYTKVKEGVTESFTSFIDCLAQTVERQCSDKVAHPHLLRSLAFANANEECNV